MERKGEREREVGSNSERTESSLGSLRKEARRQERREESHLRGRGRLEWENMKLIKQVLQHQTLAVAHIYLYL